MTWAEWLESESLREAREILSAEDYASLLVLLERIGADPDIHVGHVGSYG